MRHPRPELLNIAFAPRHRRRSVLAIVALTSVLLLPGVTGAQTEEPSTDTSEEFEGIPGGVEIEFRRQRMEGEDVVLEGDVTLRWGEGRIQADRITWRGRRYIEAEGNVLVVWGASRIAGRRMTYDMETDNGVVEEAIGRVEPEYYFTAARAEKVGRDRVLLTGATVTTCTQPVPYWSFSVGRAAIRIDHYAHMRNLRLRARSVPIFYLPYLVWPVKPDRAAGLLFPQFGSTRDRGQVFTQALFLPLGRSADLEVVGEYYTLAGFGGGVELRWLPNEKGTANLNLFFIDDKVEEAAGRVSERYRGTYRQTQTFTNGFRMVADLNEVSDSQYFTDYERELRLASTPTVLARVELTRNWTWTSLNVRSLRREQLLSDLDVTLTRSFVQRAVPEIEWRGRSRRLGRTPLNVEFQSSIASVDQYSLVESSSGVVPPGQLGVPLDYARADVFPTLSIPLSPAPWIDLSARLSYRATHYTQGVVRSDTPTREIVGVRDGLTRSFAGARVELVGPKLFRIYERRRGPRLARYKHVFETMVAYDYQQSDPREGAFPIYDEVDRASAARSQLNYGFRTRLFARRPRSAPEPPASQQEVATGGDTEPPVGPAEPPTAGEAAPAAKKDAPEEPVEILSFEVRHNRSFADPLSKVGTETSPYSDIVGTGRYNPRPGTSLDLRMRYGMLQQGLKDLSLSGNLYGRSARLAFSIVRTPGSEVVEARTQTRFAGGFALLDGKVRIDAEGSYDVERRELSDQRVRLELYTQCCGFLTEYLQRDFSQLQRNEFRFTVDLRGVGKFLDLHRGEDR